MKILNKITLLSLSIVFVLSSCNKSDDSNNSQDVSQYFSVERNKTTKVYTVQTTQATGSWEIYAGTTPQNATTKVASGNGAKIISLTDYPSTIRMFFRYVWEHNSSTISSERLLPMEGAYNVRDMGGYKTIDGKSVKWSRVFRSGDLNKLSTNDLTYLAGVGIKNIVDFRDDAERAAAPDKTPSTLVNTYSFAINTGSIIDMSKITTLELAEKALVDGNKFFITDCQDQYKKFFGILAADANAPVLFHCSAGKDRAGLASALFLSSLGVDRETIIKDYLMSGAIVAEKYAPYVSAMPILAPVFETRLEYIMAAFNTIDTQYGGVESFLKNQLGVDVVKMRTLYTE